MARTFKSIQGHYYMKQYQLPEQYHLVHIVLLVLMVQMEWEMQILKRFRMECSNLFTIIHI